MQYDAEVGAMRGHGDCCVRAVALGLDMSYAVASAQLSGYAFCDARHGVDAPVFNKYLASQGWTVLKSDGFQPYLVWALVFGLLDKGSVQWR